MTFSCSIETSKLSGIYNYTVYIPCTNYFFIIIYVFMTEAKFNYGYLSCIIFKYYCGDYISIKEKLCIVKLFLLQSLFVHY